MRGKAIESRNATCFRRIIPAGAGKSTSRLVPFTNAEDHPRGCGEKPFPCAAVFVFEGSSPRVRGKATGYHHQGIPYGIIPAGAGKSFAPTPWFGTNGDHPRGCGEKFLLFGLMASLRGSSPRVRGKALESRNATCFRRIIPAGAGKSTRKPQCYLLSKDHPRGCGEKQDVNTGRTQAEGSSPRVRGKGGARKGNWGRYRIIPAGAGKSP